jgi:hypothetical protein
VRKLRRLGARVLVPIQQGAMVPATFDRAVAEVLGFTDYVRAIPSNKDAMPDAVLESFVRATRPRAVHLLGVGPRNPRLRTLRAILDRLVPGAEISCDSNLLAAHVGHTNGLASATVTSLQFRFPCLRKNRLSASGLASARQYADAPCSHGTM